MLHQRLAQTISQNDLAAPESSSGLYDLDINTQVAHALLPTGPRGRGAVWRLSVGLMKKDACVFLQVELLIENEAEKDYLYDVLRLYHR